MKNTYHTEIYPNLGMFRTKTRMNYLKHLKNRKYPHFHCLNNYLKTKNNIKLGKSQ